MQFSALFSYMIWDIELKFCIWLCYTVILIKFECRPFASIFVGVMPLLELKLLEIHSFPHFSLTCFDILSWNFAYDFVLLYYRSSSSVVNLRQFLWELCPFWNLNYWKYSFPHFSLTCFDILSWNFAYGFVLLYYRSSSSVINLCQFLSELCPFWNLNYWKYSFPHFSPTCFDILSWNFAHDFVLMYYRSSLSVVNLCKFLLELCPFWNLEYCKFTVFRTFLLHALTYWVEILHMALFYCTTDQLRVSSIFVGVMPLLEIRILKIYSFPLYSLTCSDLLSWKFAYGFVLLK